MNSFVNAVEDTNNNKKTVTTNGMKARVSTANHNVDFFFKAGAMRGQDVIPTFTQAFAEDKELALRITQWLRDARGGAGERKLYRDILLHLEKTSRFDELFALMAKTSELGRWDDLLIFTLPNVKEYAYKLVRDALVNPETQKLVAKWLPREKSAKSAIAKDLAKAFDLTPKQYRKLLVSNTEVVETLMCQKKWDAINFNHVPSLASSRYKKAFNRNTTKYAEYVAKLASGDKSVKVNAQGLFPYDVLKGLKSYGTYDTTETAFLEAQWNALPNLVGDAKILPLVDVSGSMECAVGTDSKVARASVTCMDVAVSLGLYLADKNEGAFNGLVCTFHSSPKLIKLTGTITEKYRQLSNSDWGMNTNLEKAFKLILDVAVKNKVAKSDMPEYLAIMSDMQFDACTEGTTAFKMIKTKFKDAGYEMPKVIFWNIKAYDNVPVKFDKEGVALVSGFSPSIVKSVLQADLKSATNITPFDVMLETVMNPRYDLN